MALYVHINHFFIDFTLNFHDTNPYNLGLRRLS